MEPRTKQQTQHKGEARKKGSATPSNSARNSEEYSRIRLSKRRQNGKGIGPSTKNKTGARTVNKRTKTKGTKSRSQSVNSGAAARTRPKNRSAATARTKAAKKTNLTGQKSLRKENLFYESEELTSLKHQLSSTQEALQKVLQCYGIEFFPSSLGERSRDTSKGTAETLVQRELLTLKRLLYLISGGQVPLPVPPDFFYVLAKQYLEGTWTDICSAAAKTATGVLPGETETPAAAGRTAVSVETVHEIPAAAQRKASRRSAAAVERTERMSTTAAPRLPAPGGVSAGAYSTPQIEEVEQCIRVEIEGEEPLEWRDVYRLPEQGPPVLVSSSANERACAASISRETLKREAAEMLHEKGDEQRPPSPDLPIRSAEQQEVLNRSDVGQREEQLEQRQDVTFTVQPQHAAARTWKQGRGSSQSSLTPTESEEERGPRASTTDVRSLRERRVTLPERKPSPPGNACRSSSPGSTQQGLGFVIGQKGKNSNCRRTSAFPQIEPRHSRRRPLPWGVCSRSMGDADQEFRARDVPASMGVRHVYTYSERMEQQNSGHIRQRALSPARELPLNTAEVLSKVFRTKAIRRKSELEDTAGTRGRLSPVGQARAGTALPQQQRQPKLISSAAERGGVAMAKQQPVDRKSGSSSWFAAPVREIPNLEKDTSSTSTGRMYFAGGNTVDSASRPGQSGVLASSRVRSISSLSNYNGFVTGRQGTGESDRNNTRAASTQERNSERSICRKTAAIASLFPPAFSSTAGETQGTSAGAAAQGRSREPDESSSERPSLSGEKSDSNGFVPAPGRRRESGARGSSVDSLAAAALPSPAATAASRVPFQQRGQQQQKTKPPLFVGGSASPLGRPLMRAAGAPELAAVRAALAAATAAAGADDTHTAYIFNVPPYTGGSPPQSAFYYTPPQLPASPPPSPVFPVFPTATAAAPGRSSVSAGEAGFGRVFIPPSAAYPYGARVPDSFMFPPPPPSPASPVFGSWETHDETTSVPLLLAVASCVEKNTAGASLASSQSEGNSVLGEERQQDDGLTAAARAARAATTHKAILQGKVETEEEMDGWKETWKSSDSQRHKKQQEEASKNRGGLQRDLPRFIADVSGARYAFPSVAECTYYAHNSLDIWWAPLVFELYSVDHRPLFLQKRLVKHEEGKSSDEGDGQKPGSATEASASHLHLFHQEGTPHNLSGSPIKNQEEDGEVPVNEDVTAADSSSDGYDEAAAAALGYRVYRHSARPGDGSYDVFKTAAVQAVLLAHAQEVFVPVFWNEDGAPVSWPRMAVSLPLSAGARRSPVSEDQQGPQRQKQQEVQSVAASKGETKHTVFVAAVPCSHHEGTTQQINNIPQQAPQHQRVDPLRFSPPEGRQCQRWGHMDKSGFSRENPVVLCRVAHPTTASALRSHVDDWNSIQSRKDHGLAENLTMFGAAAAVPTAAGHAPAVIHAAASAPPSAARSTVSEDISVTPWCGFKHALLSPYSRLIRDHLLTSACCAAAPSRPSSAKSRSAIRIPLSKFQEQQHHQQHQWPNIQTKTANGLAADSRRSRTITDAYRMRRAPADVVGKEQKAAEVHARVEGTGAWYATAFGLGRMSSAATGTTPRTLNWSPQTSSKRSPGSPQQQKTPAKAECKASERTEPPLESHTEQTPTCAATLERLDSILREASNLDARLQQVDGKVEKLLRARRRSRGLSS